MTTGHHRIVGAAAPSDVRDPVAALVQSHGVREAARLLGCSRAQVTAIACGARVLVGTVAQAREGLRRLTGEAA